jgi:hypothetical protein
LENFLIGIIPASGLATRFRGIPKFLLPAPGQATSLLEYHIIEMMAVCERVLVGVRPEHTKHLDLGNFDRVELVELETKTMTETVLKLCAQSNSNNFLLTMPDTIFIGEKPTNQLVGLDDSDLQIAIWEHEDSYRGRVGQISIDENGNVLDSIDKSLECTYPWFWGAMRFNRKVLSLMDPDSPHVGYVVSTSIQAGLQVQAKQIKGKYFDCGSFENYDAAYKAHVLGEMGT